jgi:prepilin-type N-terminal cleavage/methylation domain-containing protein
MKKRSFTFLELIIVVTIFSILSLAVYGTFNSGLRLWQRIQDKSLLQRKVLLGMERISKDLHQALNFSKIGFSAKTTEIVFAVLDGDEILKVTYFLEAQDLYYREENFRDVIAEKKNNAKLKRLLSGIENLKFSFAYEEAGKEQYSWKDTWEKTEGSPPLVIKIELKVKDVNFVKTIPLPIS